MNFLWVAEGTTCRKNWTQDQMDQRWISCAKAVLTLLRIVDTEDPIDDVLDCNYGDAEDALDGIGIIQNMPCGQLSSLPMIEVNRAIENAIRMYEPTIVLTHYYGDNHSDHKVVYEATKVATRPSVQPNIHTVLMYEVLSSSENSTFKPNVFLPLTEYELETKKTAMSFYTTEFQGANAPRTIEGIETLAKYRGLQCAVPYAEAFMVERINLC